MRLSSSYVNVCARFCVYVCTICCIHIYNFLSNFLNLSSSVLFYFFENYLQFSVLRIILFHTYLYGLFYRHLCMLLKIFDSIDFERNQIITYSIVSQKNKINVCLDI